RIATSRGARARAAARTSSPPRWPRRRRLQAGSRHRRTWTDMQAVQEIIARAVPLDRSDVDTDQIIPAEWLKRVERTGFGEGLFAAWRKDPTFSLNSNDYRDAQILIAGPNFGTGSSREHAVWALQDYGFRAVISPRFAD